MENVATGQYNEPNLVSKMFVDTALLQFYKKYYDVYFIHYTDNILISHAGLTYLQEILQFPIQQQMLCGHQVSSGKKILFSHIFLM